MLENKQVHTRHNEIPNDNITTLAVIYMCTCMYIHMYMYVHAYACTCIYMHIHIHVHVHTVIHVHVYTCSCIIMNVHQLPDMGSNIVFNNIFRVFVFEGW